jgi:hypothetical protein
MALRDAARSKGGVRWPGRVDPSDPDLRRQGFLLAALATAALVGRTGMGVAASDPERRLLLAISSEDESLAERFRASEEEILRRKGEPVDYPVPDFLADLWEVPERLLRPGRILPPDEPPAGGGPFRIAANHDDRVVRMYDFFRDKYGSPRGERRADLYLAVLSFLSRRREDLERAGDLMTDDRGKFAFRPGYLDVLLRRPPAWFESA